MIWATVSSWSCLCWLYTASPSLAAKNIISLISVLTIWWFPWVESSLVLLEEGVCYDQCILCYPLPCFILYSKAKFFHYSRYFLTSYFCIPVPFNDGTKSSRVQDCHTWTSPDGQHQNQIDYILCSQMEKLYTVSKDKTRSWLWLRSWSPYCQI